MCRRSSLSCSRTKCTNLALRMSPHFVQPPRSSSCLSLFPTAAFQRKPKTSSHSPRDWLLIFALEARSRRIVGPASGCNSGPPRRNRIGETRCPRQHGFRHLVTGAASPCPTRRSRSPGSNRTMSIFAARLRREYSRPRTGRSLRACRLSVRNRLFLEVPQARSCEHENESRSGARN